MRLLRGLLDRLILLAAVLTAGCIPAFITQYRQHLGGRLDQVRADLVPFQVIADRSFGGSLAQLVSHHQASADAAFHQEGAAVQAMIDAVARLRAALQGLDTDLPHQFLYLLGHPDPDLLRATWHLYQPGFTLTPQSVLFALVVGGVIWLLFLGLWHLCGGMCRLARRRHHRGDPPPRQRQEPALDPPGRRPA